MPATAIDAAAQGDVVVHRRSLAGGGPPRGDRHRRRNLGPRRRRPVGSQLVVDGDGAFEGIGLGRLRGGRSDRGGGRGDRERPAAVARSSVSPTRRRGRSGSPAGNPRPRLFEARGLDARAPISPPLPRPPVPAPAILVTELAGARGWTRRDGANADFSADPLAPGAFRAPPDGALRPRRDGSRQSRACPVDHRRRSRPIQPPSQSTPVPPSQRPAELPPIARPSGSA